MVGLGSCLVVLALRSVAVADEPVSFRWSVAERFGAKNDRGVPEFHWDARKMGASRWSCGKRSSSGTG